MFALNRKIAMPKPKVNSIQKWRSTDYLRQENINRRQENINKIRNCEIEINPSNALNKAIALEQDIFSIAKTQWGYTRKINELLSTYSGGMEAKRWCLTKDQRVNVAYRLYQKLNSPIFKLTDDVVRIKAIQLEISAYEEATSWESYANGINKGLPDLIEELKKTNRGSSSLQFFSPAFQEISHLLDEETEVTPDKLLQVIQHEDLLDIFNTDSYTGFYKM